MFWTFTDLFVGMYVCYGLISYFVCPRNCILPGIHMALCYHIVKSKEFKLIYSKLSESCTIAELTTIWNLLFTNTTGFSGVVGNKV